MNPPIAVCDACVLYPAPLRDLLMHLARLDVFRARWTDRIHDEWIRNLHADRPELTLAQLQRTRRLMDENVLDCLVVGYESLIDGLTLPDPDDRHVLAAAVHTGASTIVTFNLSDFPDVALAAHGVVARRPDDVLYELFDENTAAVCEAVRLQRANLKRPPYTVEQLLDTLEKQTLPRTVARLREFADSL